LKKKSHSEFLLELKTETDILSKFEILEEYVSAKKNIKVKCLSCGDISDKIPTSLLKGKGCKSCAVSKLRLTEDEIQQGMNKYFSGYSLITPVRDIISTKQKIKYVCNAGHHCSGTLNSLRQGHGCRKCAYVELSQPDVLLAKVNELPHIKLVGGVYKNSRSNMLFECTFHGLFEKRADTIMYENKGCPSCAVVNNKRYSTKIAERNKSDFLNKEAHLYVITIEDLGTKVGITTNLNSRIKQIESQSGKSVHIHLQQSTNLYDAIMLEDKCLINFKRKLIKKCFDGYTELLDCSPEEVIDFINKG
jgi:predicted  nucleic acid-binding Zn-ribbon protein